MNTLSEIEAAVESLPVRQQEALFTSLAARLGRAVSPGPRQNSYPPMRPRHSILDIPPVHLGSVLRPLSPDDDLLGEMLEDRR
jgi:hypothetical protein